LLLPLPIDAEENAMSAALEAFESLGVGSGDIPTWLDLEIQGWKASGKPSRQLVGVVAAYISAADDDLAGLLSEQYFGLHKKLSREPLLQHDGASALLSHARLIALLAGEDLSAAQIANLLVARDARTPITWRHVQTVLPKLGFQLTVRDEDIERVDEADRELELEVFADGEEEICQEMVAEAGLRLGFPGDLLSALRTLLPTDKVPIGPYLQMLHFQCILPEFYDHDPRAIYEFKPRGGVSELLLKRYPDSLEVSHSAYLNNAKGVDKLGYEWARSKKRSRRAEAHALVQIIEGLSSMGFAAKRELASWLRQLLVRRIRHAEDDSISLPEDFMPAEARRLLDAVAHSESRSRGIVEQRLVDAVCSLRYPSPLWIARGLTDSVNATNISRRKCGDCDFQDSVSRTVVAYEAHAGRLSDIYVRAHLGTLGRVLDQRKREWSENIGPDLDRWRVKVVFVAHEIELPQSLPPDERSGVQVEVEAITFADLFAHFDVNRPDVIGALRQYVLEPLGRPRTPDSVRRTLLQLISP
jgi:hypothetical protein